MTSRFSFPIFDLKDETSFRTFPSVSRRAHICRVWAICVLTDFRFEAFDCPDLSVDAVNRHHVADHGMTGREHPVASRALVVLQLPVNVDHVTFLRHVSGKHFVTIVTLDFFDFQVNNFNVPLKILIDDKFHRANVTPIPSLALQSKVKSFFKVKHFFLLFTKQASFSKLTP
jgi:hypothetical protein